VRKTKWISIRRLKAHEFYCTLRYIRRTGLNWYEVYARLGEVQNKSTGRLKKMLSSILICYLLLVSLRNGSLISVTWSEITASVPVSYFSLFASFQVFFAIQFLQATFMIMLIRASESVKHGLPRFSANMYDLYHGQDEMALTVPILPYGFLKEKFPISATLSFFYLAIILLMLVPIIAFSLFLLNIQIELLTQFDLGLLEKIATYAGIFVNTFSILLLAIFNIPIPLEKNSSSIRWGFLARLYPRASHPRAVQWLEKP
jgi:hypothetical protein